MLTLRRPVEGPASRLTAIVGRMANPALLESVGEFGDAGRWSILAAQPRLIFESTSFSWKIKIDGRPTETGRGDALQRLAALLDEHRLANPDDAPEEGESGFAGGMIGYFSYDLAPRLERLPRKAPRTSKTPDVRFGLYDTAIVREHRSGRLEFQAYDLLNEGSEALERRWERWETLLNNAAPSTGTAWLRPPRSNFKREEYLRAVERALEYIRAGDVFQVNLSQRFSSRDLAGPICRPDAMTLYRRLKDRCPAPYSAFLQWGDTAILSASPESFYATTGRRIVTRPVKGTRRRGESPTEDAASLNDLLTSPKDRAELAMIVDLERNDLGRVCEYGSIRVMEPRLIESFANVHHGVATVEGRLRDRVGPIEVVRAMFPGGSITGAPKIRAMEIIDELEDVRRGVYTGSIGYFSRGGASAFNIAIRTLVVEGERVHYQVGGGIVADSDPEQEYLETLDKGRGLRQVVEWHGEMRDGPS